MRARPVTMLRATTAVVFSLTGVALATRMVTFTLLMLSREIVKFSIRPTFTPRMLTSPPTCRPSSDCRSK
jgi:hypothetical protein